MINKNHPLHKGVYSNDELKAISIGCAPEAYTFVYRTSDIPDYHKQEAKEMLIKRNIKD